MTIADDVWVRHLKSWGNEWCSSCGEDWPCAVIRLADAAGDLLAALEKIAVGAGPFSRDPLTHAANTIDAMKETARAAIANAKQATQ